MRKVNSAEMRTVEGGWYMGTVYCPVCGRKNGKKSFTLFQRMAHSKSTLQGFLAKEHGSNQTNGYKLSH